MTDDPVRLRMQTQVAGAETSILQADLKVVGEVLTDGAVELYGQVDGMICARTVLIGQGAQFDGQLVGEIVTVSGAAGGRLTARTLRLENGARVSGDVRHQRLAIEEGAEFEGSVVRSPDDRAWEEISKTFSTPGVELTDEAERAVAGLHED